MAEMLQKTNVRAPGLSTDDREHPFVWYFGAGGWLFQVGRDSRERKFSPKFFWPKFFQTALGSWTSAPSSHGCPAPKCLFSRISRAWLKFLPPGTSAGISAWTSAGYPALKLTLWAAFSFLRFDSRAIRFASGSWFEARSETSKGCDIRFLLQNPSPYPPNLPTTPAVLSRFRVGSELIFSRF